MRETGGTEQLMNKITFEEAIKNTFSKERLLLLGNGFSRSLYSQFDYQTLRDTATNLSNKNKLSQELLSIFDDLKTDDFEKVLAHLNIAKKITNHYKDELAAQIDIDIKRIRKAFIDSISKIHPDADTISNETKLSVCQFLSKFSKIFTINYDLLSYWILMEGKSNLISCPQDDGFRPLGLLDNQYFDELVWSNPKEQNFYYLHGALHFFSDSRGHVFKLTRNNDTSLIKKVLQCILDEHYPLIIFEGSHKEKFKKINNYEYFWNSYNTLKNAKGSLFTLGTSLNEHSDRHIIDAIKNSQINQIFIGLYKEDSELYQNGISLKNESRNINFFDSETAINWKPI